MKFNTIKFALIAIPILITMDPGADCILQTDTLDYPIGIVLA
jgi:hypothetical protein